MSSRVAGQNLHPGVLVPCASDRIFLQFAVFVIRDDDHLAENILKDCLAILIISSPLNDRFKGLMLNTVSRLMEGQLFQ
jgi:hypothetical protein